jgi:hypothetical protein
MELLMGQLTKMNPLVTMNMRKKNQYMLKRRSPNQS